MLGHGNIVIRRRIELDLGGGTGSTIGPGLDRTTQVTGTDRRGIAAPAVMSATDFFHHAGRTRVGQVHNGESVIIGGVDVILAHKLGFLATGVVTGATTVRRPEHVEKIHLETLDVGVTRTGAVIGAHGGRTGTEGLVAAIGIHIHLVGGTAATTTQEQCQQRQ